MLVSTWLCGAASARAASVIIVRPANSPPVMVETLVRLKGELTSAGFETEIVDGAAAGSAAATRAPASNSWRPGAGPTRWSPSSEISRPIPSRSG